MTEIPHRAADDPAVRDALAALRQWDAEQPTYDVARGAERFRTSVGLPSTPPGADAPTASWTQRPALRLVGGVLVVAAAAALLGASLGGQDDAPAPVGMAPDEHALVAAPLDAPIEAPVEAPIQSAPDDGTRQPAAVDDADAASGPADARAATTEGTGTRSRPSPRSRRDAGAVRRSPADRPTAGSDPQSPPTPVPSELSLVRQMRTALASAPRRALDIGARLDTHYPDGVLLEERAALRVLALDAAGKDARPAARAFVAAHPDSAFVPRIHAVAQREKKTDVGEDAAPPVQ